MNKGYLFHLRLELLAQMYDDSNMTIGEWDSGGYPNERDALHDPEAIWQDKIAEATYRIQWYKERIRECQNV